MTFTKAVLAIAAIVTGSQAYAEMRPTLAFSGVTGLIDMPSGDQQADGTFSVTKSVFGPVGRTTLTFQISPRLSGSFRYTGNKDWDRFVPSNFSTYYDRSFDLRYQLLTEGQYRPAVTIGLQDVIGTGRLSGEYLAATKTFGDNVKVTAGLGWGRYATYGAIGAPFGARDTVDVGNGGTVRLGQWFRGDAAPFAGIEWQVNQKFGLKAEYSSDGYLEEADVRKTFVRKSPFNFGAEYQVNKMLRLGLYSLYGSEVGFAAQFALNPKSSPTGGSIEPGPIPVYDRPAATGWSANWVTDTGAITALRDKAQSILLPDGIIIESIALTTGTAQVRIRNTRIDNAPQSIGRTARVLTAILPPSIERFEIVPVFNGIPASKVVIRRSDIEALEFTPGQDALMRERAEIMAVGGTLPQGSLLGDGLYPKFSWNYAPYLRTSLFDPDSPFRTDFGLRVSAQYDIAPGLIVSGTVTKKLFGNLDTSDRVSNSVLTHVRSDSNIYDREGDPAFEKLTLAWYTKPAPDVFGRVTVGYLERMYGGISGELLWKPTDKPYGVGVEINYAKQRDFNQLFGFQNYGVVTGHVSGYYSFNNGIEAELDVGRYLAGDLGATLSLDRTFANGWKVGAFATLTDVPFDTFGEGSFDKGIRIEIPLAWATGKNTQKTFKTTIRPLLRDGGARLEVDGRLYESVHKYDEKRLGAEWGRFWR